LGPPETSRLRGTSERPMPAALSHVRQNTRRTAPATFKRSGLHRLNCTRNPCPGYVYATVAQLETLGLPSCACGGSFTPERLELAALLDMPGAAEALAASVDRKLRAQHRGYTPSKRTASYAELSARALAEIRADDAATARRRRVSALTQGTTPAPAIDTEPIPF
jgi:hypothetical protein